MPHISSYLHAAHEAGVIALWNTVFGPQTGHNAPALSIAKKRALGNGLFFVCLDDGDGAVVGTTLAGYDGHRGWLYSVAVHPAHRGQGLGAALIRHAEQALAALGCMKVNLQIVEGNAAVAGFYATLGYRVEPRISMGKRLEQNIPLG
ncbi:GNAT family acetyltransferase [Acidovorax sp. SRB_24]|uniref:GNAT family acetyltransferase n=1 Tax=Acidovorax sp. SRB_24 TaxID=1962700 RepID=UPI00145D85FD|nr:GNAT family acetyltransferase [Acidovorax sp. SRB_24]NMM77002.1 GNAT family acetyltransferase [Acidovorax sp. SRB_24]